MIRFNRPITKPLFLIFSVFALAKCTDFPPQEIEQPPAVEMNQNGDQIITEIEPTTSVSNQANTEVPAEKPTHELILTPTTTESAPAATAPSTVSPRPSPAEIEATLNKVIDRLKSGSVSGSPISPEFFYGIYNVKINIRPLLRSNSYNSVADLLLGYDERPRLSIEADLWGDLPEAISLDEALSLNPTKIPVIAIVPSSGWGSGGDGEALLYFGEIDQQVVWLGAVFSFDQFAKRDVEALPAHKGEFDAACLADQNRQEIVAADRFDLFIRVPEDAPIDEGFPYEGLYLDRFKQISANEIVPFQAETALVPFIDTNNVFDGNVWGELALVDLATGAYEVPFEGTTAATRPVVFSDDTFLFRSNESITIWRENKPPEIEQFRIDNHEEKLSNLYISPDLRFLLGIVHSNDESYYLLQDRQTGAQTHLVRFSPLPRGYLERLDFWNGSNRWLAILPEAYRIEDYGITVVDAYTGETTFLGTETTDPCWISEEQLRFTAKINGALETHLYDAAAEKRYRLIEALDRFETYPAESEG